MPTTLAKIYISGNNNALNDNLKKCLENKNLEVLSKKNNTSDYQLFLYDLGKETENLTTLLLNDLESTINYHGKVCLVLAGSGYYEDVQPYLTNREINLRLIQTRDLYHHGTKAITAFEESISEVKNTQKISVTADGSRKYYPTSTIDLCDLIIKSLFITNTGGKCFVGITEEISDLELAYLLKKNLEKEEIILDINLGQKNQRKDQEEQDQMELAVQTQAQLNWIPKINFSDELPTLLTYRQPKDKIETNKPELRKLFTPEPDRTTINLHQKEERGVEKVIVFGLITAILLAIIPILIFVLSLYQSTANSYQAFKEIRNGEIVQSREKLRQGIFFQKLAERTFSSAIPFGRLINKQALDSTNNYLLVLGHSQSLIESIIDTYSLGNQLYLGLLGKQVVDPKVVASVLRVNLISISEKLSQIQLLYGGVKLPFGYGEKLKNTNVNDSINLLKSQITTAIPLLNILERIGTNQGIQRYLIIIQDPNELRPTGGFITTYGVLTFDQGKIIDFQVDSSLSLDRLVEGKIEPPNVVKQLLGQQNWSFRDSNLDADFKASSKQMSWFYQRFKNVSIDGVIGINTNLLRFILEQTGEAVLSDNQKVTSDNLPSLSSSLTAGKGLDVITALTQTLGTKFTAGSISFPHFSRALLKAVSLHEITVWFSAQPLELLAEIGGISGEVIPQTCFTQLTVLNCHADTIYLNESNMSINKLNYYLKRAQNLIAEITPSGQVNYILNFDYSYPIPVPNTIGGDYKVYYQLYLPNNAQSIAIALDAQTLNPKTFVQSNLTGLIKTEFSAGLTINQPHHLEVRFTSPNILDLKKQFVPYTLAILKQPGTLNDTLSVKVRYPEILVARNMTVPLKQTSANELVFQASEVSQENIGVIFKNNSL